MARGRGVYLDEYLQISMLMESKILKYKNGTLREYPCRDIGEQFSKVSSSNIQAKNTDIGGQRLREISAIKNQNQV